MNTTDRMHNFRAARRAMACSAIIGMFGCLGTASAANTVLMNATTNDGSFESQGNVSILFAPASLAPYWTLAKTGDEGGILIRNGNAMVMAGADGNDAFFVGNTGFATATSRSLFGGAYTTVAAGDIFHWSFEINSWHAAATGALKLDFGGGDVRTIGSSNAVDANLATFVTISGNYTATAADAAGHGLSVQLVLTPDRPGGSTYADNIILSVDSTSVPEPGPVALLGTGLLGLGFLGRRRTGQPKSGQNCLSADCLTTLSTAA